MSTSDAEADVAELLDRFERALAEEDYDAADDRLADVAARVGARRDVDATRTAQTVAVRDGEVLDRDRLRDVATVIEGVGRANTARAGFFAGATAFLADPSRGDPESVRSSAAELREAEANRDRAVAVAELIARDFSVPARAVIRTSGVPDGGTVVGESVVLRTEIRNVGDERIEDCTVTVSGGPAVDIGAATVTVGSVPPDGRTTVQTEISPGRAGVFSLTVTVESATAETASESVYLPVRAPADDDGPSTLTVRKESHEPGYTGFAFAVDGELTPTENAEAVVEGTSAVDRVGPGTGTDTFEYTGEIEWFLYKGGATVTVDGSRVDPDALGGADAGHDGSADLDDTLTVTKEGAPEDIAVFAVGVSEAIAPNDDAEATVRGPRALDWVGPETGTDSFGFAGEITTFLLKGRATVSVNGSEVDPDDLGSGG